MNNVDSKLLEKITEDKYKDASAINIRKNGDVAIRKNSEHITITTKDDKPGIDVKVKENTLFGIIHIPVIITNSGYEEEVYNDFYIGKKSNVIILAGCGIHNDENLHTRHSGIHRFFIEEGAKVKYIEKHYGEGIGTGDKIFNPTTEIYLGKDSKMEIDTVQIKGVDSSNRKTKAKLDENSSLIISEKIMTHNNQCAKTEFEVLLTGENSSTHVTSRSVAIDNSIQEFVSDVVGENKCYAHIECDAIIKDNANVKAIPKIDAKHVDANLIHEAAIGKIAGEQLLKLMSIGLTEKEAEAAIINGFLK